MASDEAARVYLEKTPVEEQTAKGVWDAMTLASVNMVDSIKKKDFTKYLAIANPKNGEDWLGEVRPKPLQLDIPRFHCTLNSSLYQ